MIAYMMYEEFTQAFEKANEEAGRIHNRTWNPSPMQWTVLQELYISDELDSICTGRDRHLKFARWVVANESRVLDLISARWMESLKRVNELERMRHQLDSRIELVKLGLA